MKYSSSVIMSEQKKKVVVIGTGGVGAMVAYGLSYVGKSDLSIVVRRDFAKVSQSGYNIRSCDYGEISAWKPSHIYSSVEEAAKAQEYDYVVVTTKNIPEVARIEDVIAPMMKSENTVVVLIQNGFGNEKPLFARYPNNIVLSGVSHIGSNNFNGVVTQSLTDHTVISAFENPNLPQEMQVAKAHEFISLYKNDKNNIKFHPSAKWYRYRKLADNAAFNTVCALTVDSGRLELAGGYESLIVPIVKEVMAVAEADGAPLPEYVINEICHGDDGVYYEPSSRIDVQKGNPIELQVIVGNLLDRARELDVQTPILDVLYRLLQAVQLGLLEKNGLVHVPEQRPIRDKIYK